MSGLAEQIKVLYDQKLYSNVVSLCNLAVPAADNNADVLGTPLLRSQTLVVYGESLLRTGHARKAESVLDKSLLLRKCILKPKGSTTHQSNTLGDNEIMSDMDIKYLIHECRASMQDGAGAIAALESVPAKSRSPRINMALGRLYHASGLERSAITAYKEVLRETPMALEAAEELLSLGVSGNEVGSLMVNALCKLQGVDWLALWLRALAHLHSCSYNEVVIALKQLDTRNSLRGCGSLALTSGKAQYLAGNYKTAIPAFQKGLMLEPKLTIGMDMLASVLFRERQTKELERLVSPLGDLLGLEPNQPLHRSLLSQASVHGGEVWVALGYYALLRNQPVRASHLAAKALQLSSRDSSVEALLLRGAALQQLKRPEAALAHFRDVLATSPTRYEAHAGLLDCYVAMRRMREALSQAANSCKKLGQTPRALTLYAQVLVKEPGLLIKAKSALEKAITQDQHYLPAIYLLADILEKENQIDEAIALLLRHVEARPNAKLHSLLGEMHSKAGNVEKALEHFSTALNYDPKNRQAQDGIVKIDCAGGAGGGGAGGKPSPCFLSTPGGEGEEAGDNTLDMAADCIEETDTEPDDADPDGPSWPDIA